jgi:probable phosphoglycerate mutase
LTDTPVPSSRLIVARHGRTAWNEAGRYQGHADIPIDALGAQQALALVAALAPVEPACIVVSDLMRTRQTAAPLAAATGIELRIDPRLREIDVGAWEGLTREQAAVRFPDEFRRWDAGEDLPRGGGETRAAAAARGADALADHLGAAPADAVVVVVSHGMVLSLAVDELAARGLIDAGPTPHLGNGAWLDLQVAVPSRAPRD